MVIQYVEVIPVDIHKVYGGDLIIAARTILTKLMDWFVSSAIIPLPYDQPFLVKVADGLQGERMSLTAVNQFVADVHLQMQQDELCIMHECRLASGGIQRTRLSKLLT